MFWNCIAIRSVLCFLKAFCKDMIFQHAYVHILWCTFNFHFVFNIRLLFLGTQFCVQMSKSTCNKLIYSVLSLLSTHLQLYTCSLSSCVSVFASQLLKSSSDDPNQRSRYSEEIFGDIDGSFNQLNEKVCGTCNNFVFSLMTSFLAHSKPEASITINLLMNDVWFLAIYCNWLCLDM